jgi:DNA-directed RNA polymerase subunit beta'
MADAAQNVIINERDCGSPIGMTISAEASRSLNLPFEERIFSRYSLHDVVDPSTGEILATPDDLIEAALAAKIAAAGLEELEVRSPVSCMLERGICARCYGSMLADNRPSIIGEAVGIVAAQSIGEPGTQLTMRNFHTGGIASDRDITTGLPRVQELFEARNPKSPAILSEIAGIIRFREAQGNLVIAVENIETFHDDVEIPAGYRSSVGVGDWVDAGSNLLSLTAAGRRDAMADDGSLALPEDLVSQVSGEVESIDEKSIRIVWQETDEREYIPQNNADVLVADNQEIEPGAQLTDGTRNPHDILRITGIEAVQRYLVEEAQRVYRSQGVKVHDKHFEVVVRQMLQKVKIESTGDSKLLIDEVVDRSQYLQANEDVREQYGDPATAFPVLLGISRVSLMSQSFLAKASFQETERVLTDAALQGSVDRLTGLKENVIIGRMIPARLDRSPEGRELLGLPDPESVPAQPVTQDWEQALAAIAGDDMAASLAAFNAASDTASVSIGFSGEDDGADETPEPPDFSNLASAFFGNMETPEEPVISFDDDTDNA